MTETRGSELSDLTLLSEKSRTAILVPLLTGLTLLVFAFGCVAQLRGGGLPPGYSALLLVGALACLYTWIANRYLMHVVKRGVHPARIRFYLNAVVELSVPTAMIWIAAIYIHPASAISSPASYSYFLFIVLSALRLDFALCVFTGIIASLAYGLTAAVHWPTLRTAVAEPPLLLGFSLFVRSLMFALGGLVAGLVSLRIRSALLQTLHSARERERILSLFGQHLSPVVVDRLLSQPQSTASDLRQVCVLVLDLRNFTAFAEKHSPNEIVALLNRNWDFMIRAVNEHHGFINKFLGDGFLAVFGAPVPTGNHCENALAAAQRILRELEEVTASGALPPISAGIALHAGEAVVGTIGSAERQEYTVIGDVVNVAFRMEELNKKLGSKLLISETVREEIQLAEPISPTSIHLRGRTEVIKIYPLE